MPFIVTSKLATRTSSKTVWTVNAEQLGIHKTRSWPQTLATTLGNRCALLLISSRPGKAIYTQSEGIDLVVTR